MQECGLLFPQIDNRDNTPYKSPLFDHRLKKAQCSHQNKERAITAISLQYIASLLRHTEYLVSTIFECY